VVVVVDITEVVVVVQVDTVHLLSVNQLVAVER
jgi:hypothetical protein